MSYWLYRLAAVFSRHSSVMHWQALAVMHRMHRMHCPPPAAKQGRKQKKWNEPTIHSSSSSHFPSLLSPILLSQRSAAWQGPALPAKLNGPDTSKRARTTTGREKQLLGTGRFAKIHPIKEPSEEVDQLIPDIQPFYVLSLLDNLTIELLT
ncbi:hypothetical protein DL95DRAFT_412107 [Leptodontidium sp. 2 PMI_412]|nr:hypothetical protein DL95DRAFT_412107 [Leptodontidium sp. 2 PMI_412]